MDGRLFSSLCRGLEFRDESNQRCAPAFGKGGALTLFRAACCSDYGVVCHILMALCFALCYLQGPSQVDANTIAQARAMQHIEQSFNLSTTKLREYASPCPCSSSSTARCLWHGTAGELLRLKLVLALAAAVACVVSGCSYIFCTKCWPGWRTPAAAPSKCSLPT